MPALPCTNLSCLVPLSAVRESWDIYPSAIRRVMNAVAYMEPSVMSLCVYFPVALSSTN